MNNLLTGLLTSEESMALGALMIFLFVMILVGIGMYIYTSLALTAIAKKTKTEPAWLAWIPIANMVLIAKIAKMHWWPILLTIPGALFFGAGIILIALGQNVTGIILLILYAITIIPLSIFITIWYWKMFEALNRPGWWSLTAVISSAIYLILYFSGSVVLNLVGSIISIIGSIVFIVLLGVTAWSDAPKNIIKPNKIKS